MQFQDAQRRVLAREGIDAIDSFVPVASVAGEAHVLTIGDGPDVLVANGIGTPGAMLAPLLARLPGMRLHVVDLPGFGLTSIAPGFVDDLRGNAVRFLVEVLDGLGLDRPATVTNSLASLWTVWLSLAHPERVGPMVHVGCPAILEGTSAPLPMRLMSVRGLGAVLNRLRPPSNAQVQDVARMVGQYPLSPEIADLMVATARNPPFERGFRPMLQQLLRLRGAEPALELRLDELTEVHHPTLLVWGRDERMGPIDAAHRAVASWPDAELVEVEGGHAPWLTDPDAVASAVTDFLVRRLAHPPHERG